MFVVDWPTFAALPAGTLFCFCYQDKHTPMGHICVKKETRYGEPAVTPEDGSPAYMPPVDFSFFAVGPCEVDGKPALISEEQLYSVSFRSRTGTIRVRRFAVLGVAEISQIADLFIGASNTQLAPGTKES